MTCSYKSAVEFVDQWRQLEIFCNFWKNMSLTQYTEILQLNIFANPTQVLYSEYLLEIWPQFLSPVLCIFLES